MEELVTMIDDYTEYFRGHLEVLGKGERRVYLALIDLWRPSSTGEVAARARMEVRPVSSMLGRLVSRGAVRFEGSGRKRLYAVAEPLYSIYYKLRRERDEATVVRNLIHFMVAFYGIGELYQMFGQPGLEAAIIYEGIERALAEQPHVEDSFLRVARVGHQTYMRTKRRKKFNSRRNCVYKRKSKRHSRRKSSKGLSRLVTILWLQEAVDSSLMPESLIAYILHMKAIAYEKLRRFAGGDRGLR